MTQTLPPTPPPALASEAASPEKIVFWYGCNVVRHGDIIHSSIEILRAIGLEVAPVGGPSYCCGTTKDANLRAADGMAKRTVDKFNDLSATIGADKVVTWCPSCYRHMGQFMGGYTDTRFSVSHFTQTVHAQRERLRERLVHPVKRRVVLHKHLGFREVDVNPLVEDLLRLIPGIELVESEVSVPGHMCSALASVPEAVKDVNRGVCQLASEARADDVVTVFHSCQRMICALEATEPFRVVNYATLLGESMGLTLTDEYKDWKLAGSEAAVLERIGPARVAQLGETFVREQLVPELLKSPLR